MQPRAAEFLLLQKAVHYYWGVLSKSDRDYITLPSTFYLFSCCVEMDREALAQFDSFAILAPGIYWSWIGKEVVVCLVFISAPGNANQGRPKEEGKPMISATFLKFPQICVSIIPDGISRHSGGKNRKGGVPVTLHV